MVDKSKYGKKYTKRSPRKKSSTKKSPRKKSSTKRSPRKKSSTKKSPKKRFTYYNFSDRQMSPRKTVVTYNNLSDISDNYLTRQLNSKLVSLHHKKYFNDLTLFFIKTESDLINHILNILETSKNKDIAIVRLKRIEISQLSYLNMLVYCNEINLLTNSTFIEVKNLNNLVKFNMNSNFNLREDDCSICLDEFMLNGIFNTDRKLSIACKNDHVFHTECINEWKNKKNTCPKCRQKLSIIDLKFVTKNGIVLIQRPSYLTNYLSNSNTIKILTRPFDKSDYINFFIVTFIYYIIQQQLIRN